MGRVKVLIPASVRGEGDLEQEDTVLVATSLKAELKSPWGISAFGHFFPHYGTLRSKE